MHNKGSSTRRPPQSLSESLANPRWIHSHALHSAVEMCSPQTDTQHSLLVVAWVHQLTLWRQVQPVEGCKGPGKRFSSDSINLLLPVECYFNRQGAIVLSPKRLQQQQQASVDPQQGQQRTI